MWRCHVGLDRPDPLAPKAREFLLPYVRDADAYVSSRAAFAWEGLEKEVAIIPPSIDAFSPKPRGPPRSALGAAPAALV